MQPKLKQHSARVSDAGESRTSYSKESLTNTGNSRNHLITYISRTNHAIKFTTNHAQLYR